MSVLPVGFGSAVNGGFQIERSLRFNSADSAYLNRTLTTPTDGKKFSFSFWAKRSALSSEMTIFAADAVGASNESAITLNSGNTLEVRLSGVICRTTTQLFRDPSAWYHIVIALDTTQATANDRVKVYLNGTQITAFTTTANPTQNSTEVSFNTAIAHYIGRWASSGIQYFDGYLTETYFIDGQALTPSSFGETDSATGVWKPKAYTGTYGTNGFYLKFADNSGTTSTTLGKDSSGNGNNWTPNNFSVTAGTGNDSLVDSPTSYGTDTGVGGEVRGNYATLNPLKRFTANATLSNGNLTASDGSTTSTSTIATMSLPASGKWYWEITVSASVSGGIFIGACPETNAYGTAVVQTNGSYRNNGTIYNTASVTQTSGATYTTNDVIGVAVDVDNGTVQFYKNGTAQGATPSFSFTALTVLVPFIATDNAVGTKTVNCNFGQRPFEKWNGSAYVANTAPSGFKALCTQNLPTPTIGATSTTQANDYFNTVIWTGNGTNPRSITGVGFQPDFTWGKARSSAYSNTLFDAVRGAGSTKALSSNVTDAEGLGVNATDSAVAGYITSFDSDGFSVQAGSSTNNYWNTNAVTYVAWNWNAGGSNQTISVGQYATSPANVPSIASTVRANTTSGFSIVTYTGTGANATVGHGCQVGGVATAPSMVIVKNRSSGVTGWAVWHTGIGATDYLLLNLTNAKATSSTVFSAAPTSSVFSIGTDSTVNGNTNNLVAYCFAPVAGYSAFGSYTGNGSTDGPFVYTGFRPRYILVKRTDSADNWAVYDTARDEYNQATKQLRPDAATAQLDPAGSPAVYYDLLSNGFKNRGSNSQCNANGGTYIYAAFAEHPFKYSLAR